MFYYRLYFIRPTGGIERFEEIEAPGDAQAIEAASAWTGPQPLEMWCGPRKVQAFEATRQGGLGR